MERLLFLLFILFPLLTKAWEKTSLQCWQCAAVPGYSTQCPQDAVLYELPEWNACMVWTLDNTKRVILQNFVYSHSDCTKEKLDYWSDYIFKVWRQPGSAKCCFDVSMMVLIEKRSSGFSTKRLAYFCQLFMYLNNFNAKQTSFIPLENVFNNFLS